MKKALLLFFGFVLILIICGCDSLDDNYEENKEEKVVLDDIFEYNECINLFLNKYNEVNDNKLTKEMISKGRIGGSDREDVAQIRNERLEINIYENYSYGEKCSMSVYVGYRPKIENTNDEFKNEYKNFIRIVDNTISDEKIEIIWNELISKYSSKYESENYEIWMTAYDGNISYFKIDNYMMEK